MSSPVKQVTTLHCRVVEARDVAAADPNGYSDPYVKIKIGHQKERSQVIGKSLHPVWNWDTSLHVSNWGGEILVEVGDEDEVMSNDFLGLIKLKLADLLARGVSGGWYRLKDKKGEKPTQGRIFMLFVADKTLAPGRVRTPHERASILYWATQQVVHQMDHSESIRPWEASAAVAALALSPSVATTPASLPFFPAAATASPPASSSSPSTAPSPDSSVSSPPLTLPIQSTLSLFVATWNVGNAPPDEALGSWLHPGHDVYAIGVQECKYEVPGSSLKKLSEMACGAHFQEVLQENLGEEYALLKKEEMMEMRHYVFVRRTLLPRIDGLASCVEGTGLAGFVGNKGGVSVGMRIDDTPFIFVTSHLAAHQDRSSRRCEDVRDIIASSVHLNRRNLDMLHGGARYIFWSGDLNFRLDYGDQGDEHSPTQEQFDAIVAKIFAGNDGHKGGLAELYATDQLNAFRAKGLVFPAEQGWVEGDASKFIPTFKVARVAGTEYKSQRSPAWCDRILHRVGGLPRSQIPVLLPQFAPRQTGYGSSPGVSSSDHKPVWSSFLVPLLRTPLATDFTRGSLSIRFHHLEVTGLGSYADRRPTNPLVKFFANFLLFQRETKHKEGDVSPASTPKSALASSGAGVPPPLPLGAHGRAGSLGAVMSGAVAGLANAVVSVVHAVSPGSSSPKTPSQASASTAGVDVPASAAAAASDTDGSGGDSPSPVFHWSDDELPLLQSQVNNLDRLRTQPLLLKLLSYSYESRIERLLALAEIDLAAAGTHGQVTQFETTLSMGGLPAGKVTGAFALEWAPHGAFTPLTQAQTQAL